MKKIVLIINLLILSMPLFADSTFVSGTIISETWTTINSPYCVTGDIFIAGLTIEPGVTVLFQGNYTFEVGGVLTAKGTKQDSIKFTKANTIIGWQGIFFNYSVPGSELAYCIIEGSMNSGIRIDNSYPNIKACSVKNNTGINGGGIYVIGTSTFTLDSCNVQNNFLTGFEKKGAGIYINGGEVKLNYCRIERNSISVTGHASNSNGGGIYVEGILNLTNCKVSHNSISAYSNNIGVTWTSAYSKGGGILVIGSVSVKNSYISNNYAYSYANGYYNGYAYSFGGGIYIDGTAVILNSIVSQDTVIAAGDNPSRKGGGIYVNLGNVNIKNSTLAYNQYHGIRNEGGTVSSINSIFYFNTAEQISGNASIAFSNIQGGYPGSGNINLNPVFGSVDSLKIVLGSPCIDAGNPDSMYNDPKDLANPGFALWPALGTTRNDMGAHGGPDAYGWLPNATPLLTNPIPDQNFGEDSGPRTVVADLNTVFADPNPGDLLSFAAISSNPDIQLSIQNDSLLLNSSLNYFGEGNVVVTATDPGFLSVSDTFSVVIAPVNDLPIIQLPDSVQFYNDSSTVLHIWDYIEDVETSDSLLNYEFRASNDSLLWNYNSLNGEIALTAPGFIGTCFFYVAVTDDSSANALDSMQVVIDELSSVLSFNDQPPTEYILFQNYPNPFNPITQIRFGLPSISDVKIEVYNILGERVAVLLNERKQAGYYSVEFDAHNLTSGLYFYRINIDRFHKVMKMMLIK